MLDDRPVNIPTTPIDRSLCKSTPRALTVKPPPPSKVKVRNQTEDDISVQNLSQAYDRSVGIAEDPFITPAPELRKGSESPKSHLEDLPPEILEGIVGHAVGHLGSTSCDLSGSQHNVRNWNAIMRHPRRKKVADLALVSHTWRRLIQERVYRHIKVQGTRAALKECGDWFLRNPHLQGYMRHFEVLIPIWEMRPGKVHPRFTAESRPGGQTPLFRAFERLALSTTHAGDSLENTNMFRPASQNATLDEIFGCAQAVFPFLCALTIEGGHCKRPPKLRYFRNNAHVPQGPPLVTGALSVKNTTRPGSSASLMRAFGQENFSPFAPILHQPFPVALPPDTPSRLPKLMNTKTLILKGAWNIVRSSTDFSTLASALPSLREFHCTYHKPKTGAYAAISDSLNYGFPPTITHLNLCLEGLYTKNASSLKKWRKLYPHHHICRNLGAVTPQLESLTYTGRVCGAIFSTAMRAADQVRGSCTRLKSIDILVNNVCRRDPSTQNDGSGIHNLAFIQAFETLVVQGVRSLQIYSGVKSMRIRFIDLDSPVPQLNPMFHLEGRIAWGFWSEEILMLLKVARPEVRFLGWPGGLIDGGEEVPERDTSGVKRSMSAEYYKVLAQAGGGGLA